MKSNGDLGSHKNKIGNKVIPLSLALVILVVSTSPISSLQFINPAMAAGTLKSVAIMPTSNVVNERATYEILFGAATTGTIKTIRMVFPSGFDVSAATRLIERSGISSGGSLTPGINNELVYTLNSAESVSSGKGIRLEIGRIMNPPVAGNYKVEITTLDEGNSIIDGPTLSGSFPIKDITGNDVSPNFMIRKTLLDDSAGFAKGWKPDGIIDVFFIEDSDIDITSPGAVDSTFVSVMLRGGGGTCGVSSTFDGGFVLVCPVPPFQFAQLHYEISKLPPHLIVPSASASASASSTISSPFSLLGEH